MATSKPQNGRPRHPETACQRRTEWARSLDPIMRNVAFWMEKKLIPNVKIALCYSAQGCFPNGQETSSKWQPPSFKKISLATPKQHAQEGSVMRRVAFWANTKPAPNGSLQAPPLLSQNCMPCEWRTERARSLQPIMPNSCCLLNRQEISSVAVLTPKHHANEGWNRLAACSL